MSLLSDLTYFLGQTLFPWRCLLCQNPGGAICANCLAALPRLPTQVCLSCLKPSLDGVTHPNCQTKYLPEACFSLLDYNAEDVSKLIIAGKYKLYQEIFSLLAPLLAQSAVQLPWSRNTCNIVCPLPLHKQRHRWRGFNQSEILSSSLAPALSAQTTNLLSRQKKTRTQKDLSLEDRKHNVAEAFTFSPQELRWWHRFVETGPPTTQPDPTQTTVWLIDDVRTSGSTLRAACSTLKHAGFAQVYCLTLAAE